MARKVILGTLLMGALLAPLANAATSGTSNVTLAASAVALIQIDDAAITLTPNATDYGNDYVEATGAAGIDVEVKTNSTGGLALQVRCADAAPQIALADLLVRTATAPGAGGSSIAAYTAITAANQNLWTTGAVQHTFLVVSTDVRVTNLINYNDAAGGGTTGYTNTLTYTVVAQ
jgi:hypothetical protein